MYKLIAFLLVGFIFIVAYGRLHSCDELKCASVVSKCMVTESCKFYKKDKNCTSCATCKKCLGDEFLDCCSCVDLCPPDSEIKLDGKDSVVGLFNEINDYSGIFEILFKDEDHKKDFSGFTFPYNIDIKDKTGDFKDTVNCTVQFYNNCTSNIKCKQMCAKLAASSYRFFFNGCCECVGRNCINYGLEESRCENCPALGQDDYDEEIEQPDELINTL